MHHARTKWQSTSPDLKVGQLVLLTDEGKVRDLWKLGCIKEIQSDGSHVRSAWVRVAKGTMFERHVSKLVPLELD